MFKVHVMERPFLMGPRTKTYSRHFLRRTARKVERDVQHFLDSNPSMRAKNEVGIPYWACGARVESFIRGPFAYKVVLTETRGH